MGYTCYHCEHETENIHQITLYHSSEEQHELLCDSCYREWLESLKG